MCSPQDNDKNMWSRCVTQLEAAIPRGTHSGTPKLGVVAHAYSPNTHAVEAAEN